ncbi:hypothetical protein [Streptomyces sp. NPDC086787]|uniref:hypothetical protein n=1 Tax=Streptomyces sp. NPDC086787 TaxID=3365759 RepID=UPI0037F51583
MSVATCNAGEIAVAGGYTLTSTDLVVTSSAKSNTPLSEEWIVEATNTNTDTTTQATLTAWVICLPSS